MLMFGNAEATEAAFQKASTSSSSAATNNRLTPVSMEPRAAIGDATTSPTITTLYTSLARTRTARATEIGHIFHVGEIQVRVVAPDVGGGFGLKGGAFPDDALVPLGVEGAAPPGEVGGVRSNP